MSVLEIRGFAYQDIVSILIQNGYDVTVKAQATRFSCSDSTYVIEYKPHDFDYDLPF